MEISSDQQFAVKIISRRVDALREVRLLEICQGHPGVVKLVEVLQDECHTYLVMEMLRGGELFKRIRKKRRFTESEAAHIVSQLVSVVNYMHTLGVVHRDIKPENLLFDIETEDVTATQIKVVDFGFARLKPEMESGMLTPCFTLQYAAPEVLEVAVRNSGEGEGYNESCDLWSLGVVLVSSSASTGGDNILTSLLFQYAMLSGRSPFFSRLKTDSASHVMRRIKEGDFRLEGEAWRCVSSQAKSLTKGLLTVDPRKRLSMEQLRSNSWVMSAATTSASLQQQPQSLMTTSVLVTEPLERCLKQTYDAFHNVTREGFRLSPLSSASSKLIQRRKLKQSLSSDTDRSSLGSKGSGSSSSGGAASINVWAEGGLARNQALTLPLTVQVPGQSSPLYNSSQYFLPSSYSISLLHSNLNVITSSSVMTSPSPYPGSSHGPLTRSRKRKLVETTGGEGNFSQTTKVQRQGTIVLE